MDKALTKDELLDLLFQGGMPKINDYYLSPDMVEVVRCKNCAHSAYPEERIVWCKRQRVYMPLNGYCSYGGRKADSK